MRAALAAMVAASAAPYGYTISIWSSGAVLMDSHGNPTVAEVFAYLAGALAAYRLLAALTQGTLARPEPLEDTGDRVRAGTMNWLACGTAVGTVALLAMIPSWAAWPLGAFAATTLYISIAAAQLRLATSPR